MSKAVPSRPYAADSELCLSVMTLRNAPLAERVQAAAAAGFRGVGWRLEDFTDDRYARGLTGLDILHLFETSGVRPVEVEFFREWIGHGDSPAYRAKEDQLLELAERVDAKRINVAVFETAPKAEIVRAMRALCRRAAMRGLLVQLEPMTYTPPVNSLQHAWEIIRSVDEPNAGLLIDTWQWAREGESAASLRSIPAERITGVQLSDTLPAPLPDTAQESRHHRRIPDAGSTDLPALLRTLAEYGVQAPLSVEVMSDELDALSPTEAAGRVVNGARAVLRQLS